MRKRFHVSLMLLSGLLALAPPARADEEDIPAKQLPAAVRKAIKAEFPKARIEKATKEEEDGETTYEVELKRKKGSIDVAMKADGTILEIEKEVEIDDLPKAIKKAIKAKYPQASIAKVEAVTKGKNGPVTYEVALTMEVVFTDKGKIVKAEKEEEDEDDEKEMNSDKDDDDDEDDEKEMKSKKGDGKEAKAKKDKDEDDHKKQAKSGKDGEKKQAEAEEDDDEDDDKKEMKAKKSGKKDTDEGDDEDEDDEQDDA